MNSEKLSRSLWEIINEIEDLCKKDDLQNVPREKLEATISDIYTKAHKMAFYL